MLGEIKKYQKTSADRYKFSVLIPTWNNLDLLKLCISGIRENSYHDIQIIVFINEGNDGTLEWIKKQNEIDYLHSEKNIGICYGMNLSRSLIKSSYIIYLNDDMYVLPGWDVVIEDEIEKLGTKYFMLSSTVIEPIDRHCSCVIVKDYGNNAYDFKKTQLLRDLGKFSFHDWNGSMWPPNIVHIDLWDLVGGLSTEFSPGMYSDPDFAKKLYDAGVRMFKGLGKSLVYHSEAKQLQG